MPRCAWRRIEDAQRSGCSAPLPTFARSRMRPALGPAAFQDGVLVEFPSSLADAVLVALILDIHVGRLVRPHAATRQPKALVSGCRNLPLDHHLPLDHRPL